MQLIFKCSLIGLFLLNSFLFAGAPERFYAADFMDSDEQHILMDYASLHVPSEDKTYYECMVWDTKTGKSKLYYYNYTDKAFKAYGENVQLPSNPLPNVTNGSPSYQMDYSSVHVPSEDKSYYECIVWDAKTGESELYFYSYTDKAFKAYGATVQLPKNPLPNVDSDRDVRMSYSSIHVPSEDKTYYECMVWDTKTGKSKLYFYSYTDKVFKAYGDNVQLPANPLPSITSSNVSIYMDYTSIHVPSEDKTYYECMVWDSKTGLSKLYFYDYSTKTFKSYGGNVQLPSKPLGEINNSNILMDYSSVHVPSQDKTYYECIVWDTKTGKSKLYFYNYTDKAFKAYGDNVQLPASPIAKEGNGLTLMKYASVHVASQDKTYYECIVWDSETGKSKLYYYNYTSKTFVAYGENVQLPSHPLD